MQVKIVIGTIAFMLTMTILGYAALREPERLEAFTAAAEARSIETGAKLFQGNCATCHGVEGKTETCYDAAGNQIGCAGLPLNYAPVQCGDVTQRMQALSWEGSKEQFFIRTISAGRAGSRMVAWSSDYGGPLRADQIKNIADFVMNWETEELCSAPQEPAYAWPDSVDDFLAEFPEGDAANGANLFAVTYGCGGCHGNFAASDWAGAGPWVGQIAENAPRDVAGITAEQYVYNSILHPNDYIVDGFAANVMPQNFPLRMGDNPQDMADILAYIFGGGEGE